MLEKIDWPQSRSYRTGTDYEPIQFYLNSLSASRNFDLLLGYFSSAAINVLSLGFAKFIHNGGTLRIIANHILSKEDKNAILMAREPNLSPPLDFTNISELKYSLNDYGIHFFKCLAYLIAIKRIEIKIVKPKTKGITHYKSGIFYDGKDKVSFQASCNFTAYGLLENAESLNSFLSTDSPSSVFKIKEDEEYFERIFSDKAEHLEYINPLDIEIAIKTEFGGANLDELLVEEKDLIEKTMLVYTNPRLQKELNKLNDEINEIEYRPRFPYYQGPRDYQKDAYSNWRDNRFKGIFAMATGTGKTITSLNCLLEESQKNEDNLYHALIIVPTITLVNQWEEEAKSFNFKEIIKVSSKNKWEKSLATTLSSAKRIPLSFIVITTYASFIKERFFKEIKNFPSDTILIADEAHNIGAPSVLQKTLEVPFQKRIGLSATPKRIYDLPGSLAMESFFDDKEPFTYSFSMERAIEEGILCKYYYHPHIVTLTAEETNEYIKISRQLAKLFDSSTGGFRSPDIAEKLLLKRKRIIHKAENKLSKTIDILKRRYYNEGSLAYTFIYVPEGQVEDSIEFDDDLGNAESIKIINQYTRAIGNIDESIRVNQFVSGMKNRDDILDQFKEGKIDVIASMKCLDEGVDIPRAEHAIFCSSTGNPRQFIQRRGRILRKHPDKIEAIIHDLVVIPDLSNSYENSDTYNVERNLVEKELERVMHFASLSLNPYETETIFDEICAHYNLNIYTIHQNLKSI